MAAGELSATTGELSYCSGDSYDSGLRWQFGPLLSTPLGRLRAVLVGNLVVTRDAGKWEFASWGVNPLDKAGNFHGTTWTVIP